MGAFLDGHPELWQHFGDPGVAACREDTDRHIDHLASALLADDPAIFVGYACWLAEVLTSRDVPITHLAESFALLDGFCSVHLPAVHARRVTAMVDAARSALARTGPMAPPAQARMAALATAAGYRERVLAGDEGGAREVITVAMRGGATLAEVAGGLIQPAMTEVGRLWQANRVSVAQEHRATAINQTVMADAYLRADFAGPVGRKALFASVAGNHHNIGLRMLSDAFETVGWDVGFLGADLPLADLLRQADADRPELVCLSLALPGHLLMAREAADVLRAELGSRCPTIWVGGPGTFTGDSVWRAAHADGWAADAVHALAQAAG